MATRAASASAFASPLSPSATTTALSSSAARAGIARWAAKAVGCASTRTNNRGPTCVGGKAGWGLWTWHGATGNGAETL
ncbi:unnamed protein product [Miscanthus lutarioriparius]|uniref:Uncharacterized protein n=1 Tax=Miscanthus lutarioriparius TaxID=422564 RepID=A0A811Q9P2_9POAL|nr:unnamed protein product [Miscanthus lutarioriparius]